jgi:hypothetical protein
MRSAGPLFAVLLAIAPSSAAGDDRVLVEPDPAEDPVRVGVSLGVGYATADDGDGGTASLLPTQVSLDLLFLSHWEGILDLRVDFDPASPRTPVYSYTALAWFAAHFDLLPLSPLVGLGGGAMFDGTEPGRVTGTVGACFGLALWFEASWRLTLRGAQRLNFDTDWTMPFDLLLTAEYFF